MLNSYLQVSCYSGVLFGFVVGAFVDYYDYPKIIMVFPVAFICAFVFCPDTPQQLLKQQRLAEAERSLRFYRNANYSAANDADGTRERKFQTELFKLQQIAVQNAKAPALGLRDFRESNNIHLFMV